MSRNFEENPIYNINQKIIKDIKAQLEQYVDVTTPVPFEKVIMNSIYKYKNIANCKMLGIGTPITDVKRCPVTSVSEYLAKVALQDLVFHVIEMNSRKDLINPWKFTAQMAIDRIDHIIDKGLCEESLEDLNKSIAALETLETLGAIVMDNIEPGLAEEYKKALEIVKENLNTNIR